MQSFRATTPDLLRGERGWMSQIKTAAPGGGRKMFLTSPFIEQAIALTTRSMSEMAMLQQQSPTDVEDSNSMNAAATRNPGEVKYVDRSGCQRYRPPMAT